jgi:hypothetical protein
MLAGGRLRFEFYYQCTFVLQPVFYRMMTMTTTYRFSNSLVKFAFSNSASLPSSSFVQEGDDYVSSFSLVLYADDCDMGKIPLYRLCGQKYLTNSNRDMQDCKTKTRMP